MTELLYRLCEACGDEIAKDAEAIRAVKYVRQPDGSEAHIPASFWFHAAHFPTIAIRFAELDRGPLAEVMARGSLP